MSKERIEYTDASITYRFIALVIDIIIGIFIAILCQFGAELEWEIFWSKLFDMDTLPQFFIVVWFIIGFPLYHIVCSNFTNGQTVGKMLLKIRVVTDDYNSTKRIFTLHLKRFFFMKQGTRVVKEKDPEVKGL